MTDLLKKVAGLFADDVVDCLEGKHLGPTVRYALGHHSPKPRPRDFAPGQVWLCRPLTRGPYRNVGLLLVLTYISDTLDHFRGLVMVVGDIFPYMELREECDVLIRREESPIDEGFVVTWRGSINLLPEHLKEYYGEVSREKLLEMMEKEASVVLGTAQLNLKPELQPYRESLQELTASYDAEAVGELLA